MEPHGPREGKLLEMLKFIPKSISIVSVFINKLWNYYVKVQIYKYFILYIEYNRVSLDPIP